MPKTGGGEDRQTSTHSTTLSDKRFEMFWGAYLKKIGDVYPERLPQSQPMKQSGTAITRILPKIEAAEAAHGDSVTEGVYDN